MKYKTTIITLTVLTVILALMATLSGILMDGGPGITSHTSVHGKEVLLYGKGLYRYMSADVAIQGIAQDYITLLVALPLLLMSLIGSLRGSISSRYVLMGVNGYLLVTYWFYTAMGAYNQMFLAYAALMGMSFFSLVIMISSYTINEHTSHFSPGIPNRFIGAFLVFNAVMIAILWLGVVVPPLLDGTIYPPSLKHYTSLIVQGYDLGLLLPISLVAGLLLMRNKPQGYLYATIYLVFLSLLMTALSAKITAMALHGVNVIPVVFIIPVINLITIACASRLVVEGSGIRVKLSGIRS